MPAPSRTSLPRIVDLARDVLARDGVDAVTMRRVAELAGVRAPSLYKHVANRAALLRKLTGAVASEVRGRLDGARTGADAAEDLRAIALALRAFAHRDPHAFGLLFTPPREAGPVEAEVYADAAAPLLETAARLAGPERALDAARTLTAWAAGFLGMELAGAFHLGGNVDTAYDYGIEILVAALREHGSVDPRM